MLLFGLTLSLFLRDKVTSSGFSGLVNQGEAKNRWSANKRNTATCRKTNSLAFRTVHSLNIDVSKRNGTERNETKKLVKSRNDMKLANKDNFNELDES